MQTRKIIQVKFNATKPPCYTMAKWDPDKRSSFSKVTPTRNEAKQTCWNQPGSSASRAASRFGVLQHCPGCLCRGSLLRQRCSIQNPWWWMMIGGYTIQKYWGLSESTTRVTINQPVEWNDRGFWTHICRTKCEAHCVFEKQNLGSFHNGWTLQWCMSWA